MLKKFFKYFFDKITYHLKKRKLERILRDTRLDGKKPDMDKWYEAYVDWCFLTGSSNLIYCSYIPSKKK